MSTKQSPRKNSKSNMSLGSALLLLVIFALVRWYGGDTPSDTTATQSSASDAVAQATLQPLQVESASGDSGQVADAEAEVEEAGDAEAGEAAKADAALSVATLPPVESVTATPAESVSSPAQDAPPVAQREATPTRAPPTPTNSPEPTSTPRPAPTATPTQIPRASDLPLVFYDELPLEAQETIALIDSDGPFPFYKDGATFQNRERLLPRRANGYYREYTVITPWEDDRGARRIVAGDEGELYYTDDHYASFREVVR